MKEIEMTKAEDKIMQIIWKLEHCFINDIIKELSKPKPAYTTVSTIVRILEKKGFVGYKIYGNSHEYYPLISKVVYSKKYFKNYLTRYFSSSFKNMVSFFSNTDEIDVTEMEEILKILKKDIKNKKRG